MSADRHATRALELDGAVGGAAQEEDQARPVALPAVQQRGHVLLGPEGHHVADGDRHLAAGGRLQQHAQFLGVVGDPHVDPGRFELGGERAEAAEIAVEDRDAHPLDAAGCTRPDGGRDVVEREAQAGRHEGGAVQRNERRAHDGERLVGQARALLLRGRATLGGCQVGASRRELRLRGLELRLRGLERGLQRLRLLAQGRGGGIGGAPLLLLPLDRRALRVQPLGVGLEVLARGRERLLAFEGPLLRRLEGTTVLLDPRDRGLPFVAQDAGMRGDCRLCRGERLLRDAGPRVRHPDGAPLLLEAVQPLDQRGVLFALPHCLLLQQAGLLLQLRRPPPQLRGFVAGRSQLLGRGPQLLGRGTQLLVQPGRRLLQPDLGGVGRGRQPAPRPPARRLLQPPRRSAGVPARGRSRVAAVPRAAAAARRATPRGPRVRRAGAARRAPRRARAPRRGSAGRAAARRAAAAGPTRRRTTTARSSCRAASPRRPARAAAARPAAPGTRARPRRAAAARARCRAAASRSQGRQHAPGARLGAARRRDQRRRRRPGADAVR